jgi:hypothetical protein
MLQVWNRPGSDGATPPTGSAEVEPYPEFQTPKSIVIIGRGSDQDVRMNRDRESTYGRFRQDSEVLARIGASLSTQPHHLAVSLPASLAAEAAEAWGRDEGGAVPSDESFDEGRARSDAATLALIGLAVTERGRPTGDTVLVPLSAWPIGLALDAADSRGLISRPTRSEGDTTITLTRAEALIVFEWLHRMEDAGEAPSYDPAERVAAWNLSAALESVLVEPFESDYPAIIARAKRELLGE